MRTQGRCQTCKHWDGADGALVADGHPDLIDGLCRMRGWHPPRAVDVAQDWTGLDWLLITRSSDFCDLWEDVGNARKPSGH